MLLQAVPSKTQSASSIISIIQSECGYRLASPEEKHYWSIQKVWLRSNGTKMISERPPSTQIGGLRRPLHDDPAGIKCRRIENEHCLLKNRRNFSALLAPYELYRDQNTWLLFQFLKNRSFATRAERMALPQNSQWQQVSLVGTKDHWSIEYCHIFFSSLYSILNHIGGATK